MSKARAAQQMAPTQNDGTVSHTTLIGRARGSAATQQG